MRLISATVRSVRMHRELRIDFDASRTVIGGPNESGKSTFADAIRRALFVRAKTTGSARDDMVSSIHTGHPEVEVEFACDDTHYVLKKRFSGQSGTCTLADVTGSTWSGEEAETRLADLLGTDSAVGRATANRLAQQWTHLWVVQGTSGANPLDSANAERDALMAHLQTLGAAAVMQSARDASAADRH